MFEAIRKEAAFAPNIEMEVIVRSPSPVLANVNALEALVLPTVTPPKLPLVGLRTAFGVDAVTVSVPVPLAAL